jgi:hypothetical protein
MANIIKLKNSSVASKVPLAGDLQYGELALNYTDGKLFYKDSSNNIQEISGGGGGGASVTVSTTAPSSPSDGDLWWNSEEGRLKIYYNDGSSSQWVDAFVAINGVDGTDGLGWTGGSYNSSTGQVTFTSTDGLGFVTGDLRGADGTDGTNGVGVPTGGTAGQVLTKNSSSNYDASWQNSAGGTVVVRNAVSSSTSITSAHGQGSVPDLVWLEILGTDGKSYKMIRWSEEDENIHAVAVSADSTNLYCNATNTADFQEYGDSNLPSSVAQLYLCGVWF